VSLTKTPGAGAVDAGVMTERLDRMEERMAHLEEMLQRLVESGDGH
jgi:hypothetical protein